MGDAKSALSGKGNDRPIRSSAKIEPNNKGCVHSNASKCGRGFSGWRRPDKGIHLTVAYASTATIELCRTMGPAQMAFYALGSGIYGEFAEAVRALSWDDLECQSGLNRTDMRTVAAVYARSNATIACYGMGLTQHRYGVETVQLLCNLMLPRGNVGKPGAGLCPVRGHSNIQGQRTVGHGHKPELAPLDKFAEQYGFEPPRDKGYDTTEACGAIINGKVKAFIGMGGNFVRAAPDTAALETTWLSIGVQI